MRLSVKELKYIILMTCFLFKYIFFNSNVLIKTLRKILRKAKVVEIN